MQGKSKTALSQPRYTSNIQAETLFRFLRETYSDMPKPVRVLGWIVFLFLFVFLVLYPLLGITYFEAKVIRLDKNEKGQRCMSMVNGLRVYKGKETFTNEAGEFTLAVRVPKVPLIGFHFDFGHGQQVEQVSLPGSIPFVSLFNPNQRKVFYVPGSKITNKFGIVKRYFIDEQEAAQAFGLDTETNSAKARNTYSASHTILLEGLGKSGELYAAVRSYSGPTYTLRLRELKISNIKDTNEVYFDIKVDGNPIRVNNIPHYDSPQLDYLTVFPGVALNFRDLYLPLKPPFHRVEISLFGKRFLRDQRIGSVAFKVEPEKVGKIFKVVNKNLELTLELLPPVAIRHMPVAPKKGDRYVVVFWVDILPEHLKKVINIQYDMGPSFLQGYVTYPEIDKRDYYAYTYTTLTPTTVKAKVIYVGGSIIKLVANLDLSPQKPEYPLDYYFLARAHLIAEQREEALVSIEKAIQGIPDFLPALLVKAAILGNLKRYDKARLLYKQILALDPLDPSTLNDYAWLIVDKLPNASRTELLEARKRAQQAIDIRPAPCFYDTLGWANFKLDEFSEALKALQRAKVLQSKMSPSGSGWQGIHYHLAHVYLRLSQRSQAKAAFQEVVRYGKTYPVSSNHEYVQDANNNLKRLD